MGEMLELARYAERGCMLNGVCCAVAAAAGWARALVEGGLAAVSTLSPGEARALAVHGGLAAFFLIFWRRCRGRAKAGTARGPTGLPGLASAVRRPLLSSPLHDATRRRKPIRVWIDGCYDLTHFGHYNAFRQARALGDYLIVGLNPDSEVIKYKGSAPVNTDDERYQVIKACKWVDEVVRDVPYVLDEKYLHDFVFGKMQCDYVVHGDDPCLDPDGNDVFASSKRAGRYREIKRTEGVSTTDLLGRMLQVTEATKTGASGAQKGAAGIRSCAPCPNLAQSSFAEPRARARATRLPTCDARREGAGFVNFLPTSRRIAEFSSNRRPRPGDRIVYVDGAFDLLHQHHIALLRKARALGDFLIVGVHKDEVVNKYKGYAFPVMNLMERVLAVLSCRYVDEVIIGAPWEVTDDLLTTLNISTVAHGSFYDETVAGRADYEAAYSVPRAKGLFCEIASDSRQGDLQTVSTILERVEKQREQMAAKFEKKAKAERNYYTTHKTYVEES
jgi:ethanolamine-phosphate cytidylyltransferase